MAKNAHLPAYPLVCSDPFLSLWSFSDDPAGDDTRHWAGERKRMECRLTVDGNIYALLGKQSFESAPLKDIKVTPCATVYTYALPGAEAALRFRTPALLDDFELLSMPVTYVDCVVSSTDGNAHQVEFAFVWHDDICYNGEVPKAMVGDQFRDSALSYAYMGRKRQDMLCQSGDHITIDWGYAYLAAKEGVVFQRQDGHYALSAKLAQEVASSHCFSLLLGYDDIAAINYFGHIAKAWYQRKGASILDALAHCHENAASIHMRLDTLDAQLMTDAERVGGKDYVTLVCAAYRQSICAHKLIADAKGNPVFLSKENDSNGCIGTVDISYPSMPLYLMFAPELVRAMCRPVLEFANMPVWKADYAPHDVGRYPHVTGQVYGLDKNAYGAGLCDRVANGEAYPPLYLYRGDREVYDLKYQMPVEECGNMILLLAAAMKADGGKEMVKAYLPTLDKWVRYLMEYGEDPGEQLCTDDFAGHLAHNVNLAFKAVCGVAAYGWMLDQLGETDKGRGYSLKAKEMAGKVYESANCGDHTALTLDKKGWSLKYNTIWDQLFGFGLLDSAFYQNEIAYYLKMQNEYGVPLDSRADYTKSDWIMWVAAMGEDTKTVAAFAKPVVKYLCETPTRVPFSDWYDTKTGRFCHFIARAVQGGIFMPMLKAVFTK